MYKKLTLKTLLQFVVSCALGLVILESHADLDLIKQQQLSNEARQAWWTSLTPRQRVLNRSIDQLENGYYEQTKNALPVTQENLLVVMQAVGARQDEAGFVRERLNFLGNFRQVLGQADGIVGCAKSNPNGWYMPGGCN